MPNANVKKARPTKNKKICFNTRPAVMTYADKVLFNTAMSASRKQNINITNDIQEVSKRMLNHERHSRSKQANNSQIKRNTRR